MEKKLLKHVDRIINEAKIKTCDGHPGIVIDDQSFLIIALELFFDMSYGDLAYELGALVGENELVIPLETAHLDYDWFDADILLGNGDGTTKQHFIEWLRKGF